MSDTTKRDRFFSTGSRRDSAEGKPPLSKLPFTALGEVAFVHQYGDDHYGIGNWRRGQTMTTFIDSGMRHAKDALRGEDFDPKSGRYHLAHAAWNMLIALHQSMYPEKYAELDDRMDDFGEWVNEMFAQTELAKRLEAGDALKKEPDPVQVASPHNGEGEGPLKPHPGPRFA